MLGPGQTLFDSSNHCLSVCVSMSGSLSGVLGRRLALSSKLVFSATERHIFHVCTAAMACAVGELASMRRRKSRFAPEVFFLCVLRLFAGSSLFSRDIEDVCSPRLDAVAAVLAVLF